MLLACFALLRWAAGFDRRRARIVTGRPIERRYKRPRDGRLLSRIGANTTDPQSWKDLLWLALASVLGLADAIIAATVWAVGLGSISLLAWWWAVDGPGEAWGIFRIDTWEEAIYAALIGVGVCLLAPYMMRFLAAKTVVILSCSSGREGGPRSRSASSTSSRPAPAPSRCSRRSCSGSSATSTTALKRAWSRSRWTWVLRARSWTSGPRRPGR